LEESTGALAETGADGRVGTETAVGADTVRGIAAVGLVVTFAVTAMLGVLSSFVGLAPLIADAVGMDMRVADAIRLGVAAGLLWCPLVAAKVIAPRVGLVQHVHFTFGIQRTVWGFVLVAAMGIATIAAEITGRYGWFLLAVLLMLGWGARTGVILNRLNDEQATAAHAEKQRQLHARIAAVTDRLMPWARGASQRVASAARGLSHRAAPTVHGVLHRLRRVRRH